MKGLFTAIGEIGRLSAPYFKSEEKWFARGIVAAIIALVLASTYVQVQLNLWNLSFFNALQMHNLNVWLHELGVFVLLGCSMAVVGPLRIFLSQWLQIRWRRWMTERYLADWMRSSNHYRMQLRGITDNPDQRISMDIQQFIASAITIAFGGVIGAGLLGAITSLASFIYILWGMSARTPLPIMGHDYAFPGYLVVAAILFAALGTILSHVVGRKLIRLDFDQQRYEADFRFGLVRVRENSEQIALLRGEDVAKMSLMGQFTWVVKNWHGIMVRTLKLGFFTGAFGQLMFLIPSLLVAPSFFSGASQLGNLMQTSSAFGTVEGSFSFFVLQYVIIAEWKAVIDRLIGFEKAARTAEEEAKASERVAIDRHDEPKIAIDKLDIRLPHGAPLLESGKLSIARGERVLVSGPSGAGKSTMFRALGGIWPFGSGRIAFPSNAKLMMIPQRPYLPVGSLAEAIAFPAPADAWPRAKMEDVVKAVGLAGFVARLEEEGHWTNILSLGEQQRVAIARALLHEPDVLFLDEATASLDEPSEARLYALLRERLPDCTIVSIGHRSALRAVHERRLMVVREGEISRLVEDLAASGSARPDLGLV